jgi:hydroxymethylpyrimidine pyrophosphatase-like HAD family hydrolase
MRYLALAVDYDGTIAHEGRVEPRTRDALRRMREAGRRLILVTGRELDDLFATFPQFNLFDRIVAENGALLYNPAAQTTEVLAPPPPPELLAELAARDVPVSLGQSIVATVKPYEHTVLEAIRDLGLEWHVIFNKGSVMILPANVTKATGLAEALEELGIPAGRTIGIGDAENDHAFLRHCGVGVAVANALPALKAAADLVTTAEDGAGVTEVIDRLLANELEGVTPRFEGHHPGLHVPTHHHSTETGRR